MRVYVLCSGQDDNIGDVVLRRAMLDRIRAQGELHIHLGPVTEGFIEGLQLAENDVVYTSKEEWRRSLWRSVTTHRVWLVNKPGELILERAHVLPHLRMLPATIAVRSRGGKVLSLGIGRRNAHKGYQVLLRQMFRLSNVVGWRDVNSGKEFGVGQVMPDWGFAESRYKGDKKSRTKLVVAYRGDRQGLSLESVRELRRAAERLGLAPVVAVQVRRDRDRAQQLAEQLDCQLVDWPEERSHREQEDRLRQLYAESSVVVSDRLHVLIVAMCEGALPLCLTQREDQKVAQHFDAVGYPDVVAQIEDDAALTVNASISRAATRSAEAEGCVEEAQRQILRIEKTITSLSRSSDSNAHG